MAVYKRRYAPYIGSVTPGWSRFFVLTRFAFADLFKSRFFVLLLILSLVPCLVFAAYIFIANNKTVQLLLPMGPADLFSVEARYFTIIMIVLPVLLLMLFGFGISFDVTRLRIGLVIEQPTPDAEWFLASLSNTPYFDVRRSTDRR